MRIDKFEHWTRHIFNERSYAPNRHKITFAEYKLRKSSSDGCIDVTANAIRHWQHRMEERNVTACMWRIWRAETWGMLSILRHTYVVHTLNTYKILDDRVKLPKIMPQRPQKIANKRKTFSVTKVNLKHYYYTLTLYSVHLHCTMMTMIIIIINCRWFMRQVNCENCVIYIIVVNVIFRQGRRAALQCLKRTCNMARTNPFCEEIFGASKSILYLNLRREKCRLQKTLHK